MKSYMKSPRLQNAYYRELFVSVRISYICTFLDYMVKFFFVGIMCFF